MIAIDIDSTLYPFMTAARKVLFEMAEKEDDQRLRVAAYHSWHQWRDPVDLCGAEAWIKVVNEVHTPSVIRQQTPYQNAVEVVSELAATNEIVYISNRNQAVTYEPTFAWLLEQGFPEAELICCENDSKSSYLKGCQYLIDDRPRTLVEFVHEYAWKMKYGHDTKQRVGFSLLHQYNESLTDIPGIYLAPSWIGIRHYLKEEGLL